MLGKNTVHKLTKVLDERTMPRISAPETDLDAYLLTDKHLHVIACTSQMIF